LFTVHYIVIFIHQLRYALNSSGVCCEL